MPLAGAESVMDELRTQLAAHLPARVAAVAGVAPALNMPAPASYLFGARQNVSEFPAVMLRARPSPVVMDAGQRLRFRYRIDVGVVVIEADEEKLERLLLRYSRAIVETLIDRRNENAFSFECKFSDEEWDLSPTLVADDTLFMRDMFLPLACERTEMR